MYHRYKFKSSYGKKTKAFHGVLWNNNIHQDIKRSIFHCVVENIVLYRAEK